MIFEEDFLVLISEKPVEGILEVCEKVRQSLSDDPREWLEADYDVFIEALGLISSMVEMDLIFSPYAIPSISGNINEDCKNISEYLARLKEVYQAESSKLKLQSFKAHFKTNIGNGFKYEFSQGDLDRIQALVNELREHVSKSGDFEEDHKNRLLSRLEKLQAELHKKMSDLDRFWGLIGDAGVVIGKFGDDVKPIEDRIKEITEIVWRTQARAEELPSDSPLPKLEDKSES
jgi:hypothetical protein